MGGGLTKRRRLLQYLQVVASALLLWAAFPEVDLWFLSFPALALLIGALDDVRPLRGAWYASLWCMIFFLCHIPWMITATGTLMPWIVLSLAQAFFLAWFGAFFAASGTWKWCRSVGGEALVATVLWVGIEQLRARIPFGGFPWAKLAYAQVDSPLIVLAPIGGEVLVSGVVVFLAVLVRKAFQLHSNLSPWWRLALLGVVAVSLGVPAFWHLPTEQQNGSVRLAVVQGNVEVPGAETFAQAGKVTGNHIRETERFLAEDRPVDLIIWGEDSVDRDPMQNSEIARRVGAVADEAGVPILVGFQELVEEGRYNWSGVWYPLTGLAGQKYAKQHPVPWGEYVPFRALSEWLATEAAAVSVDMIAADNLPLLTVRLSDGRTLPLAVGICFEVADESIINDGVAAGGEIIVIPTNNFHFEATTESTQQLQMARFRAAEFSRSTVQASTNGVSGIIRPDGGVLKQSQKQVADVLYGEVPLRTELTPAARAGQWPAWGSMAVTLVFGFTALIAAAVRKKRHAARP